MKKRHGVKRAVEQIAVTELEQHSTRLLLARLQKLRWCEDSAQSSDLSEQERATVADKIIFKDTEAWRQAYRDIKTILSKREHVD